jgi:hypothetical protein
VRNETLEADIARLQTDHTSKTRALQAQVEAFLAQEAKQLRRLRFVALAKLKIKFASQEDAYKETPPVKQQQYNQPVAKNIKAAGSDEELEAVVELFNKHRNIKKCGRGWFGCSHNDSDSCLVTTEVVGELGCGCQHQPKGYHL